MSNQYEGIKKSTVIIICFAVFFMAFAAVPAQVQQTTVSLNTPELVKGNMVYAAVEIDKVNNLDAGQFDLSFKPNVLKVVNIEDGSIEGTKIPVQWRQIDADTVRVVFNLECVTGISGSGQLARIGFDMIGDGESDLLISRGLLGNTKASLINEDRGVTTAADVQESTPGFGVVFALMGLTVFFYMLWFSRKL